MDIRKQQFTNPVTLTNTKQYPFNNSRQTVAFQSIGDSPDYLVQTEVVSSTGEVGDITISDKAVNGFNIAFTGSASSAVIRYRIYGDIENKSNKQQNYVKYTLTGTLLSLREGELVLDLSHYQRDYPVHLDISENASGKLVLGLSHRYIAEVDIPAREYRIEKGETDNFGFPKLTKIAVPLDPDKISLTLWETEV